ncbi:MAG: glycosyltransferase family 2 protein [Planktomarina sp.]
MGIVQSYKLRLRRKKYRLRARRKSKDLRSVVDRSDQVGKSDLLLFTTQRNEMVRLPYFLKYYRAQGINHFFVVDNGSTDGSTQYLAAQNDVTLFSTDASYRKSRFGIDWMNHLLRKYGDGHWCLTVDPDEFFIYPFCDTRPLRALTDWLDASSIKSFSAMLLDMYPKGSMNAVPYVAGDDPFETSNWFDCGNYTYTKNPEYGNLWIQGGPRARTFFADAPDEAPALNKIPLVKWDNKYTYVSSTHNMLPRGLNLVYDAWGGEKSSGLLLHAKFISTLEDKAEEELTRKEHYSSGREYQAYANAMGQNTEMWCKWSEKYINWRQLEILGLMSKGNWA